MNRKSAASGRGGEAKIHEQISWIVGMVSRFASSGSRVKRVERGRDDGRLVCRRSWSQPTTVRVAWSSMPAPSECRWCRWFSVGLKGKTKELPSGKASSVTTRSRTAFHHLSHATTESSFYPVQAHRRRPPCLSRRFLHEAL
jgi:hypothetical protein